MRAIVFNGLLKSFVDYEINTLEKQIITHFLIKVGIIPVVNSKFIFLLLLILL